MEGILGRLGPRRVRLETFTTTLLALVIVAVAFEATQRLEGKSPLVSLSLGLLVVLPAWMTFSAHYGRTLAVLLLYLGLLDGPFKLVVSSHVATLGRDVLFYSIVLGALARLGIDKRQLKMPPLAGFVLAFVVVVLVQVFNPGTNGIIRGLQATRPHLEFVPLFFFGYAMMREQRDLRVFLLLICVVAAANGIVGLIQFNLSPTQLASWGPGYSKLIHGTGGVSDRTFYDAATHTIFLRPPALGSDIGFGGAVGMIAVPAILALLATANRRWAGRLGAPLVVGILLALVTSQARSAIVAAVVALVAFTVLGLSIRGRGITLVGILAVLALAVALVSTLSSGGNGAALSRYNSISPANLFGATASSRGGSFALFPKYLARIPLGGGLGQVGPGTSLGAVSALDGSLFNGETEFNYLIVELGVFGLAVFLALHVRLLVLARRLRRVGDRETRLLLAGCAAPLFGMAASWAAGPTSASTPDAPYFWFVAGVLAFWLWGAGAVGAASGPETTA